MRPHRSAPTAEVTGIAGNPADIASFAQVDVGRQAGASRQPDAGMRTKGQVFRRKIDCGNSTETSAERLVLRDPDHLLRSSRRPNR